MFLYPTSLVLCHRSTFSCSQSEKLHPNTDAHFCGYFFLIYLKSCVSHRYKSPFNSNTAAGCFPRRHSSAVHIEDFDVLSLL